MGRTGAGKSSLTLALLRCIHAGGRVVFDGIQTDSISLNALRSSITIIPQVVSTVVLPHYHCNTHNPTIG